MRAHCFFFFALSPPLVANVNEPYATNVKISSRTVFVPACQGYFERTRRGETLRAKTCLWLAVDLVPKAEARLRCERRDARSTRRRPYELAIPLSGYPSSAFRIMIKYLLPSLPRDFPLSPYPCLRLFSLQTGSKV
jgi:hypothetical protein